MITLKPHQSAPEVRVDVNVSYIGAAGIARLIRALAIAQKWLDKEKGAKK
jgi:stage V sporulation protein SpoVS